MLRTCCSFFRVLFSFIPYEGHRRGRIKGGNEIETDFSNDSDVRRLRFTGVGCSRDRTGRDDAHILDFM